MRIKHEGYTVTQMTGHATAEIRERSEVMPYVEITVTGVDGSYDLEGLNNLISDLQTIEQLAQNVEATNKPYRGDDNR